MGASVLVLVPVTFAPTAAPAPPAPAGDVVVGVVVADLLSGVSFVFGLAVPPDGVFGPVTAGEVVADLFSGVSFAFGFFGNSWPGGRTLGDRFVEVDPFAVSV